MCTRCCAFYSAIRHNSEISSKNFDLRQEKGYFTGDHVQEVLNGAMPDIGLSIDRRNVFGYSVYGDDLTLNNTNGYFARNEDGTAYLPGQYNMATQGLGLHSYGECNTITQAVDLLTAGPI